MSALHAAVADLRSGRETDFEAAVADLLDVITDRIEGSTNPAAVMADDDIAIAAQLVARVYLGHQS